MPLRLGLDQAPTLTHNWIYPLTPEWSQICCNSLTVYTINVNQLTLMRSKAALPPFLLHNGT